MATTSSALLSPTTISAAITQRNPNSISFHGLRPLRIGGNSSSAALPNLSVASGRKSSATVVKSALNPSVVISDQSIFRSDSHFSSADSSSSTSKERTSRNKDYRNKTEKVTSKPAMIGPKNT